jgi:hypothetical protein
MWASGPFLGEMNGTTRDNTRDLNKDAVPTAIQHGDHRAH